MQISKLKNKFVYTKRRKKVGIFTYTMDTKKQYFIYEEADNLINYKLVFFYKKLMNLNKKIDAYCLETFINDSGIIYFTKEVIESFESLVKKNNIGIFHAQFITDAIIYYDFLKNLNLPLLVNFRAHELSVPFVRFILPKIFPKITKIITKSNFQRNELIKQDYDKSKIEVIYGGINLENIPFVGREFRDGDIKIISAGRFVEIKNFEATINFFFEVKKKYRSAKLTLIGCGEREENIRGLIVKLNLESSVQLLDFMDHHNFIKELYSHHIFILPSKTAKNGDMEGIPNVLKEAMASGMPVISTYHAGIPELIEDGKTGFLVAEGDCAGILKKFEWILRNKRKTLEICHNARAWILKKFDVKKNINKIESIYDEVLSKNNLWTHG